jgi:glycosyltransferase involved in cell wall biosynthesis
VNILNLNTYLKSLSGTIPFFIHNALLENGENSVFVTNKSIIKNENIYSLSENRKVPNLDLSRFIRKVFFEIILRDKKHYYYPDWNIELVTAQEVLKNIPFKPDVIICYWTKFTFNQKLIYELSQMTGAPVIIFMMDMAAFTGGCHYAYECNGYKNNCGKCPALHSNFEKDISRLNWNFKKKYIDKTNITVIAPTHTLLTQVSESSLFKKKRIEKIMLSVNEHIFKPGDKYKIREELGIAKDKKVIFFGAATLKDKRKGMEYLVKSLNILSGKIKSNPELHDSVLLLIAGKDVSDLEIPFDYKYVGYLNTQEKLAQAYQAADIFACPSIEDSGPMMINEAIMTGTPVVSFDMGVAPDLVFNGETGYRATLKDSNDFARGLESIINLNEKQWLQLSSNCRVLGLRECSIEKQNLKIIELVKSVLNN